jgi:hypothetical protein
MNLTEQELINKINEIKNIKEQISLSFKEILVTKMQSAKKEYPIESFRWVQYTPYFNDGEPCVFQVNDLEFCIRKEHSKKFTSKDFSDYMSYEDDEDLCWISDYNVNLDVFPKIKELVDFFQLIDYEYFEEAFGNHAEIVFDGLEFNIEEYRHD